MIYYLVTERGCGTTEYANSWGTGAKGRMCYLRYNDLRELRRLERGTYVFTDHERLTPPELQLARQLWQTLSSASPPVRLLNDPSKLLCRLDLLQRLFDEGINRFRAVRANASIEELGSLRYPVFVREEMAHNGALTPLLSRPADLTRTLRRLSLEGYYRKELLVVEFCDTADASGVHRKYSAFKVAGKILPRHLLFSRDWQVKTKDLEGGDFQVEQDTYLETNPHEAEIAHVFELAGYDFGRIDYSVLDGKLQVWEINSNPTVRKLTPRLTACFEELDDVAADPMHGIDWSVSSPLGSALARTRRRRYLTQKHRSIAALAHKRVSGN